MTLWAFSRVAVLGLLSALCFSHAQEQKPTAPSAQTYATMANALEAIGSKYDVPIGVEYASNDSDRTPVSLNLSEVSVTTALDRLVAQKSEYAWRFDAGVYDVLPKGERDSILELTIHTFAANDATPQEVSAAIGNLPEVKEWLLKHHATRNELETGRTWKTSDARISLIVSNLPLRSILNRIALLSRRPNWIVIRYGERSEFVGIYI